MECSGQWNGEWGVAFCCTSASTGDLFLCVAHNFTVFLRPLFGPWVASRRLNYADHPVEGPWPLEPMDTIFNDGDGQSLHYGDDDINRRESTLNLNPPLPDAHMTVTSLGTSTFTDYPSVPGPLLMALTPGWSPPDLMDELRTNLEEEADVEEIVSRVCLFVRVRTYVCVFVYVCVCVCVFLSVYFFFERCLAS